MNILKFRPLFFIISTILVSVSIFSIVFWGFKPSIDFVGGSIWEISLPANPPVQSINSLFSDNNLKIISLQTQPQSVTIKFDNITNDQKIILETGFKKIDPDFKQIRFETLGPSLGKELLKKTIAAIILSAIALLLFIGSRFSDFSFGAGAVLAMFHDALILIGSFSLLGHFFGAELDTLFVTALLTTLSASVHDTVVTFDRIRELRRTSFNETWYELSNRAISEVLVRSINNSMTIIFMLFSLVLLGGSTTHWFATALLIGVICGTYSSTAVAIPLVLLFKRKK